MAPEQILGESLDARADLYSLGVILYELLTEKRPYRLKRDSLGALEDAILEADPQRHVWGLGRHAIGSNFFWYLKDPAGNFSEYYADLDCIVDDQLWKPEVWDGPRSLYVWGPPPPPSFLAPEDLGALMAGAHG